jgi:Transcription factor WhiB
VKPCQEVDPETFFPANQTDDYIIGVSKKICGGCEHRDMCLVVGNATSPYGTWGGLTEWERWIYRTRRDIPNPSHETNNEVRTKALYRLKKH